MNTPTSDLLEETISRLVTEFRPDAIYLFGSHAWGTPGAASDVDLLVILPDSDQPPIRRAQRAHECLFGINLAADILVKTRDEAARGCRIPATLTRLIMEQGKKIYG